MITHHDDDRGPPTSSKMQNDLCDAVEDEAGLVSIPGYVIAGGAHVTTAVELGVPFLES